MPPIDRDAVVVVISIEREAFRRTPGRIVRMTIDDAVRSNESNRTRYCRANDRL
jgi:hypothetical protein